MLQLPPQVLSTRYFVCVPWGTWSHSHGPSDYGCMFISKLPNTVLYCFTRSVILWADELCREDWHLSSTWCEFDLNTAYVVCISICPYFLIWYPYAPTSLFGNTAHCSGCGVAMGCYRLCIVPRTAIVTSQWYDRYCFTEYARTWARHPTTPWQREYTAITDCQSIDSL